MKYTKTDLTTWSKEELAKAAAWLAQAGAPELAALFTAEIQRRNDEEYRQAVHGIKAVQNQRQAVCQDNEAG